MPTDATALMIIRAWSEEGSAKPLRVQIRFTSDVSAGFEKALTFAGPDGVGAAIDGWLRDVSAAYSLPAR